TTAVLRQRPPREAAARRRKKRRPKLPRRNPDPSELAVPPRSGIVVRPPVTLGAWAERHGGAVDDGARTISVERVAPIDAAETVRRGDLCPLTSRRHVELAQRAAANGAALLVDAELAPRVPAGARWVHPHAAWALAGVLAEVAPSRDDLRSDGAIVEEGAELGARVAI